MVGAPPRLRAHRGPPLGSGMYVSMVETYLPKPLVERVAERGGLRPRRQLLAGAGSVAREQPARQRAPGDDPDALVDALGDHLALLLAVDEVDGTGDVFR